MTDGSLGLESGSSSFVRGTAEGRANPPGMRVALAFVVLVVVLVLAMRGIREPATRRAPTEADPRTAAESDTLVEPVSAPVPVRTGVESGSRGTEEEPRPAEPPGLLVRVVDAAGEPATGVSVSLRMRVGGQGEGRKGAGTSRAPDGLARIDLTDLAELRAQAPAIGLSFSFFVQADVASATPVRTALEGWPEEGQRVELTLPPAGALRVRLLTREGEPLASEGQLGWWWVPADVAAADPSCAYERVPSHLLDAPAGEATIEGVGLGLTLSVTGSAPGFGSVTLRGIEGPTAPGEVRALELRLGPPLASVRLRVLDPQGNPLANQPLRGEFWIDPDRVPSPAAGPLRPTWLSFTSDADGLVTFWTAPGAKEAAPRLDVSRRARDRDASADETWLLGSAFLPRVLGEGELADLGELRLQPVPVIAEGRVLDAHGNPVARANLAFLERFGDGPELPWFNLPDGRLTTVADGAFRLRGRFPRALGVQVEAKGFALLRREDLEVGARGLELRLAPAEAPAPSGALTLDVRIDPEVFPDALILRIDGRDHDRRPDWFPGRALTFERVPPGRYAVSVETRAGGLEVARVEDVEVRAGETAEDSRLLPFDVRGLARTVRLEVLRPDGSPRRRQSLRVDPLEPRSSFRARTDDEGAVSLVLPRRVTQLDVALESGERARVALGTGEAVRVVLAE